MEGRRPTERDRRGGPAFYQVKMSADRALLRARVRRAVVAAFVAGALRLRRLATEVLPVAIVRAEGA